MIATLFLQKNYQLISELFIGTENEIVKNPYSQESTELNPTEVVLYDSKVVKL